MHSVRFWLAGSSALTGALLLTGCGGGGGVASTPPPAASAPPSSAPAPAPAPAPTPTPTPTPAPAPTPSSSFNSNTAEVRRTDSFAFHGAIAAYNRNVAGRGVTIGIVDSGIQADSAEFAGRIHPQSFDATGNGRSLNGEGSHGTQVAQIAAGAKNDQGTFGMAYEASLLVLRADRPGSCAGTSPDATSDGCRYPETAMAAGLDRAVAVGARVVNISLGGNTAPGNALRQAVARATAAGVIVVLSAGNSGDSSADGNDPANPEAFAQGMRDAGGGLVIIVGSVDEARVISPFSNRAGSFAESYLTALGQGVCCVYENGALKTETRPDGTFVFLLNGTSFAAPQVAGAIALVAQAFPALTPQQIVALLYQSARDVGAAGTDPIFGRGVLDVGRAFAPVGATSLAGTGTPMPMHAALGNLSGPMGDARGSALGVVTDGFGRAFDVDLASGLASPLPQPRLIAALADSAISRVAARGPTSLSLRFAPGMDAPIASHGWVASSEARALAASLITRIGPRNRLGFAAERPLEGLLAGERGLNDADMLVAPRGSDALTLLRDPSLGMLWRHDSGRWGHLTLSAEQGWVSAGTLAFDPRQRFRDRRDSAYRRVGIGWDRRVGPLQLAVGVNRMRESASLLGARLGPLFGAGGATSHDVQLDAAMTLSADWTLSATWMGLAIKPDKSGLVAGGQLTARALSADLSRRALVMPGDQLTLRYAEPLRVDGGALALALPVAHDAVQQTTDFGIRRLSLVPQGRERTVELGYRLPLGAAMLSLNSWWRREPGHFAALDDDIGGAVRFTLGY